MVIAGFCKLLGNTTAEPTARGVPLSEQLKPLTVPVVALAVTWTCDTVTDILAAEKGDTIIEDALRMLVIVGAFIMGYCEVRSVTVRAISVIWN